MHVLGIRFVTVSSEAEALAQTFDALGLARMDLSGIVPDDDGFTGAIFPADASWIEVWPQGPEMPAGIMLQIVVDDADAFAEHAKANGLDPQGPVDAHGEHIYYLDTPSGLQVSFQSKLP